MVARVRISNGGSAKVSEIVEAVTGRHDLPFVALRTAITGQGHDLMDLDAHRRIARPVPVAATAS